MSTKPKSLDFEEFAFATKLIMVHAHKIPSRLNFSNQRLFLLNNFSPGPIRVLQIEYRSAFILRRQNHTISQPTPLSKCLTPQLELNIRAQARLVLSLSGTATSSQQGIARGPSARGNTGGAPGTRTSAFLMTGPTPRKTSVSIAKRQSSKDKESNQMLLIHANC